MIYVLLSVLFSVAVSVMLKLARRYHIDVYQAITWNYSMAIVLTALFYRPDMSNIRQGPLNIYLLLGFLLPVLFGVIATSIRFAGIVRTDVAQRLSLFIPIIASFFLFSEVLSPLKLVGIAIGFAAIICSIPWQQKRTREGSSYAWVYLLIVFIGMGVIDILFKQVALVKSVQYTASMLFIYAASFVIALIGLIYKFARKTSRFQWSHIFFGWVLGIANFGNILFYLKAHKTLATNPSVVFTSMNIGVIALGALVGLIVFKERLSALNKVGIALAIIAVVIIYQFS